MRQRAVNYAKSVLRTAKDWQDAQDALANHETLGPWLISTYDDDDVICQVQSIIAEAERELDDEGVELYY